LIKPLDNAYLNELFIALPWLYGARTEDYLEIINKHSKNYEQYRMLIYQLLKSFKYGETNMEDLCYNIKYAHSEMQSHLEITKKILYSKGIQTVIGLAFTFIPLFFELPSELITTLQTIFGTTSLNNVISLFIEEKQKLKKYNIKSPYYITYKWEKMSTKKYFFK